MPVALGVNGGVLGSNNLPTATTYKGIFTPNEVARAISLGFWPINKSQAVTGVFGAGVVGSLTVGSNADPYFEYTTLLLPGNGTNGAQNNTFLDGSTNNFTITRNGNTTQGTFSPFSQTGWSNYFSSANISCPNINFSTNAFCIEGWFYPVELSSANINFWGTDNGASTNPKMIVYISSGNITVDMGNAGTTQFPISVSTSFLSVNAWNHIAVVREGLGANQLKMYINGTMRGSGQLGTNISNITAVFNIGYIGEAFGTKFPGYISNFRIVNGSPVYTADFTPSTTPLTAITNTVLLTCQANRFVDSNTQVAAKTITLVGSPTVVPFSPFNPTASWSAATYGGSGYFDGNTDYLTVADNAALDLGNSNFTIEGWIYVPTAPTSGQIVNLISKLNTSKSWSIYFYNASGTQQIYFTYTTNGSTNINLYNQGFTFPTGQWAHIAVVRNTSTVKFYINGSAAGTGSESIGTNTIYDGTSAVSVASEAASGYLTGYIANLRIVKGTPVYTGAFTPPTAPITTAGSTSAASYPSTTNVNTSFASSECSLLLNFTNAGIYDATSKNDLETVGSTAISTAQSQFGGSSILFSSSYLSYPVQSFTRIGAGDYTFECWVRPSNVSTLQALLTFGSGAFRIFINGTNLWFLDSSSTIFQPTNVFPTANVWYYVVIVRQGSATNNTAAFINGSRVVQATNTTDFNAGSPTIGGEGASNYVAGYMQDVRLTRYARYSPASSSITVPTAAFPTL